MKIKNTTVEDTPFINLVITSKKKPIAEVSCYWSARSGVYGHQVCWQSQDLVNDIYNEGKTDGCGYCKKSDGFACALRSLGYEFKHNALGSIERPPYQKGGNYCEINTVTLKKVLKDIKC